MEIKTKKIKIPNNLNLFIHYIDYNKFLTFNNTLTTRYILIPKFVNLNKEQNTLTITLISKEKDHLILFRNFINLLSQYVIKSETIYKRKLILKGLGFRSTILRKLKKIEFKIGFSHLVYLDIPNNIKVRTTVKKKGLLSVEGTDKVMVGNFIKRIKNLKMPDSYKGKGFWYKYETKKLKPVKKK